MYRILILLLVLITGGCTNVDIETIPLDSAGNPDSFSVKEEKPEKICIYRSSVDTGFQYLETGMIVMSGKKPDYRFIIREFRKEAAKQGGDAVINFKLKLRRKGEWVKKATNDDGGSETEYEVTTRYTASGTIIRKKMEGK